MALVDLGFLFSPFAPAASDTVGNSLMDAAGEGCGIVFAAPATGTITALLFRTGAVSNSQTLRAGLQGIDANGFPDGTWANGGACYADQASPAASTVYTLTLGGGGLSVTKGTQYSANIQWAGTVGSVNIHGVVPSTQFGWGLRGATLFSGGGNYGVVNTGSWAVSNANVPMIGVSYGGTFYPIPGIVPPIVRATAATIASNTTPDEVGNRFRLPFAARCAGIFAQIDAVPDVDLVLYPDSGAALATATVTKRPTALGLAVGMFATPVTLAANTWYRVVVKPTSTTSFGLPQSQALGGAATFAQIGPVDAYKCSRVDAGSWTDTATDYRPDVIPLLDQVDDGATPDYPDVTNVLSDDTVNGQQGTYVGPAASDVKSGVGYGAGGNEFTGSYSPTGGRPELRGANL